MYSRKDKMPTCQECSKEFSSEGALNQHKISKHNASEPKAPIKIKKSYIVLSIIVLVVIVIGVLIYNSTTTPGQYDNFAKCLTEKGVKFYGAFWCPHCADQKKLFGKSIKYVDYIECSTPDRSGQTPLCIQEKIEGYPTWEFNGTKASGVFSLQELGSKSGCQL